MRFQGTAIKWHFIALAGIALAATASDASAFGRRGGSYGSYGSGGSYGSYASSGSYGSYGSAGSSASYGSYASSGSYASAGSSGRQGLFARWHARKAARKASAGSYGSYGSAGSYASSGSYASAGSYASSGSYGSHYVPVEYSAPVEAEPYCADCVGGAAVSTSTELAANGEAAIHVDVPADARVFVNDNLTTSTGSDRQYVSRGLAEGMSYSYKLRVEFQRDGEAVVENKTVRLQAGQTVDLSFGAGEPTLAAEPAKTELKLSVPADAKVFLAGAATSQQGESRTYATDTLAAGQSWDGYVVRVELTRDGQTLVKEETLTITGGETYELAFEFAEMGEQIAALD